jgi:8-oxo-dGTP pyrophosphatase MutT (NUDIX family)
MPRYRPNVALILRNASGEILVCERADWPGCWQFPQGGARGEEELVGALHREVREELGLGAKAYRVLSQRGPYRYDFVGDRKKEGYDGQEQTYFLAELVAGDVELDFGDDPEFRAARWIPPGAFDLAWIPGMKRDVYRAVFRDFFGIALGA